MIICRARSDPNPPRLKGLANLSLVDLCPYEEPAGVDPTAEFARNTDSPYSGHPWPGIFMLVMV